MADVRAKREVEGTVAEGSAVAGNPVAIGLDDGTNVVRAQGSAGGDLKVTLDSEAVAISSVIPGVGATDLGKADSAPHTTADVGVMALAVRNDDLADLAGLDADYGPLQVTQNGALLICPAANDDYKYAVIDDAGSGNNTIVALVASRKLRVVSLFMVAAGTVNARFESNADGTALTGQMNLVANSGFSLPYNPAGWFETVAGELLNLELSAAISVDGSLTYIEVP